MERVVSCSPMWPPYFCSEPMEMTRRDNVKSYPRMCSLDPVECRDLVRALLDCNKVPAPEGCANIATVSPKSNAECREVRPGSNETRRDWK